MKGQEGHRPGGFRPVEGRRLRKPWRGRSPGRQGSEVARACALRSSFPFPVGVILWSRGRNSSEGRGNGRRGEAPRGAPPAGRSKALKGAIPRALRWPRAAARRGGEQTVERVVKPWGRKVPEGGTSGWTGSSALGRAVGKETPRESFRGTTRYARRPRGGARDPRLRGRAKRASGAFRCFGTGPSRRRKDPRAA